MWGGGGGTADYVCVDNRHGLLDHSDTVPGLAAIEAGGSESGAGPGTTAAGSRMGRPTSNADVPRPWSALPGAGSEPA